MAKVKRKQNKMLQSKRLTKLRIKIDLTQNLGLNIPKENKYIIPIFIPHRGCKNECVFCNQKRISGEQRNVTVDEVRQEIQSWLRTFKDKTKLVQVAFFGGSFTGLSLEEQEGFLKVAYEFIEQGKVDSIKLSTRPDYISEEILQLLKKYNVKCIELGVQSMAEDVLIASKRGHTAEDVVKASKLIRKYGFELGHQVMIGLPQSILEKEIYTIKQCIKLKPKVVRIYPVYVLKESKLYDMTVDTKEYIPLNLDEAIERAKRVYEECIKKNINVIRIGLQTTEEINEKNEEILGPVCDNYKEKILSLIAKEQVEKRLKRKKALSKIEIIVPESNKNFVIGNCKENILYFEEKTNMKIKVVSKK